MLEEYYLHMQGVKQTFLFFYLEVTHTASGIDSRDFSYSNNWFSGRNGTF